MPINVGGMQRWVPPQTNLDGSLRSKFIQNDLRQNGLSGMAELAPLLGDPGPYSVDTTCPQSVSVQNVLEAYASSGPKNVGTIIDSAVRETNSWHRIVCPPGRADGLQNMVSSRIVWNQHMPGRRAPFTETDRITNYTESVQWRMIEHQIGAMFELAQLQKPVTGPLYFTEGMKSMYAGVLLQGEYAVHTAIGSSKNMYNNFATSRNVKYATAVERTTGLYEFFGIIQREEMGFRSLLDSVRKLMDMNIQNRTAGERAFEFVVVTQGVKSQLFSGHVESTTYSVTGPESQGPRTIGSDYYTNVFGATIIEENVSVFAKAGADDVTNPMVRRVYTGIYWTSTNEYTGYYKLSPGTPQANTLPNTKACRGISFLNFRGPVYRDLMHTEELIDNAVCFDPDSPWLGLRHDIYDRICQNPEEQLTNLNATAKSLKRGGALQIDPMIYKSGGGKWQTAQYWGQVESDYAKDWFWKRASYAANTIIAEAIGAEALEKIEWLLKYLDTGAMVDRSSTIYQEFTALIAVVPGAGGAAATVRPKNRFGVEDLPAIQANGELPNGIFLTPGSAPPGFSTAAHARYLAYLYESNSRAGELAEWRNDGTSYGAQFNLDLAKVADGWKAYLRFYNQMYSMYGNSYGKNSQEDTSDLENILFHPESCPAFIAPAGNGKAANDLRSQYACFSIALQNFKVPTGIATAVNRAERITDADANAVLDAINVELAPTGVVVTRANPVNIAAVRYMLTNSSDPAFAAALKGGLKKLVSVWNRKKVMTAHIGLEDANGATLNVGEFLNEYIFDSGKPATWAAGSPQAPQRTNLLRVLINDFSKPKLPMVDDAYVARAKTSAPEALGVAAVFDAEDARAAASRAAGSASYRMLSTSVDASFWYSNGTAADNAAIAALDIRPADSMDPTSDVVQPSRAGQNVAEVAEMMRRFGHGRAGRASDDYQRASFERTAQGEGSGLLWPAVVPLTNSPAFSTRWIEIADGMLESHPLCRAHVLAYMLTPIYGDRLKQMAEMNMMLPIGFIAVAPFIELMTNPAYFLNPNIGKSLYDYEQLILGSIPNIQGIHVDLTWYMTAFIERSDRMAVVDSIRIEQYIRGMDKTFMNRFSAGTEAVGTEYYNGAPEAVDFSISEVDNRTGSIVVCYMGATQTANDLDDVIDVSGRISDTGIMAGDYTHNARAKMRELTMPCSIALALITGWNSLNESRPFRDETWEDLRQSTAINTLALRGAQWGFNPSSMDHTNVICKGTGPLAMVKEGSGHILQGRIGSFASVCA